MSEDGQQLSALLIGSVQRFVDRHCARARVRSLRGAEPCFERPFWAELARLGFVGGRIAPGHGGVGMTLADSVGMFRELGRALLPEPLAHVAVGASGLLASAPESELAHRLLPGIAAGEVIPGVIWPPCAAPQRAPGLRSQRNSRNPDELVLDGDADHVYPIDCVDGFLAVVESVGSCTGGALDKDPADLALCWIPVKSPGLKVARQMRADGTFSAHLTFESVCVRAEDCVLGPMLDTTALDRAVDEFRLCVAGELIGIGRAALDLTLEHLRLREQFGQPLGSFQALQHRMVDLYVSLELAGAALDAALRSFDDESDAQVLAISASRAKARASDATVTTCREALQLHGAMGFADECDVGLFLKRSLVLSQTLGNADGERARIQRLWALERGVSASTDLRATHLHPLVEPGRDWNQVPDEEFRHAIRFVFEREYPAHLRFPPRRLRWQECRDFYRTLGELGLLALSWPRKYGGAGLSVRKQLIFMEEQDRWGVARAPDMGITMVGPGLIHYGTEEQKANYLPKILRCEQMWCQGFSEPDAGSDLASLRTEARLQGEFYVVNGRKLWTTFAQDATHMFLLARTDSTVKKQAGISVLLIDLSSAGIDIRPIRDIAGNDEFCEVEFQDVQVPINCLLGPENEGWGVAKMLLAQERLYLGNPRQPRYALQCMDEIAAAANFEPGSALAARLTQLRTDVWDLTSLYGQFAERVIRGETLGPEVSILKLFGAETYQRIAQLALDTAGESGVLAGDIYLGATRQNVLALFMNSRPATIYGGSSEVQRNLLAKTVLGLPASRSRRA